MIEVASKITIGKDYINQVREFQEKKSTKVLSLSEDYFISTNGYIVVKIPASQIENINDLKFCKNIKLGEFHLEDKFNGISDLENIEFKNLLDYVIKQELNSGIGKKERKLSQYECTNSANQCSIARGLQLGYNYNHCGNCHSNPERLFLYSFTHRNITIDKKNSFKEFSIIDTEDHKLRYHSLMSQDTFNLLYNLFGDFAVDIELSSDFEKISKEGEIVNNNYNAVKSRLKKSLEGNLKYITPFFKLTLHSNSDEPDNIEIIGISQNFKP